MPDSGSKLAQGPPEAEGPPPSAQILQFHLRERLSERSAPPRRAGDQGEVERQLADELAQFEQEQEADDENINYPQRMLMNVIAVAVVVILIGLGVWLADTIAEMEREQDCVLQGRQNCAPIEVPAPIHQ